METSLDIVDESRAAIQSLRRSLIELYDSVGADPSAPQETARRFGINRNLTWKISRVIGSSDPFSALNHLPGQQGIELVVQAFQRAGAPADATKNVEHTVERFNEVVARHAGDRDQFELTLESMGVFQRERGLESGRDLAFRGNSMIWGLQCRVRLVTMLVAPAPGRDDAVDCAQLAGLMGLRRLRPTARWCLSRAQLSDDAGGAMRRGPEPLDPDNGMPNAPFVVREFSSPNMPVLEAVRRTDVIELMLPGGPVGNTAAFDCVNGVIARGLPRFRAPGHDTGSSAAVVSLPFEKLVMDLLLHREIAVGPMDVVVFGFPHGGLDSPAMQDAEHLLPITVEPHELAGSPPAVATPLVPRYSQMIARVYERMGWNGAEFRGWRAQLAYPPMSSRVVFRWQLPEPRA